MATRVGASTLSRVRREIASASAASPDAPELDGHAVGSLERVGGPGRIPGGCGGVSLAERGDRHPPPVADGLPPRDRGGPGVRVG